MEQPTATNPRHDETVTVLCACCGELIEVVDPKALVLSLHLENACEAMAKVLGAKT